MEHFSVGYNVAKILIVFELGNVIILGNSYSSWWI